MNIEEQWTVCGSVQFGWILSPQDIIRDSLWFIFFLHATEHPKTPF